MSTPITPETGKVPPQGASAITSETVQTDDLTEQLRKVAKRAGTPAEHNCDCGRKWKHTTYGWVATEPAQAWPLLSVMEAVRIGAKHSTGLSHTREFTEEGFLACVAEVEQAMRAKLGAGVPINYLVVQEFGNKHRISYNELCVMVREAIGIVGKEGA